MDELWSKLGKKVNNDDISLSQIYLQNYMILS